jgi:hypothetical protein
MNLKSFVCKFSGHKHQKAGACPFTQREYVVCTRCEKLSVVE